VVIVSYNSRADLQSCLPSFQSQTIEHEVIVVHCQSSDGTVEWLRLAWPRVRVLALSENLGYTGGNNRGVEAARGKYVLVVNPDTEFQETALELLLATAKAHPRTFVTPKLLQPDGTVSSCGIAMHYTVITGSIGVGEPSDGYRGLYRPYLFAGAAVLARREDWLALSGFDEQMFMYQEDADLGLRARLVGYGMLCAAAAAITHHYDNEIGPSKFYYLERNRLLMLFRLYESGTLLRMLPALLLTKMVTWGFALLRGPTFLIARWSGYLWLWHHRSEWLAQRMALQRARTLPDAVVLAGTDVRLPFAQVVKPSWLAGFLDRLTTSLYRWLRPRRISAPLPE
jgi:GT2 family glycosyltransferase